MVQFTTVFGIFAKISSESKSGWITLRRGMKNRLLSIIVLMIFCSFAGCLGSGSGPEISGTVTLDGELVENGWVTFSPIKQSGSNAACQLNEGKFNCSIEPGEYRVEIRSVVAVETEQSPDAPPDTQDVMKELLPACYNDKSKLSVVVVEGSNKEDFVLSSSEK